MTALLWQTALLLLGAYFLGAFTGCLIRRSFFASVPAEQPDAGAGMPAYSYDPAPIAATAAAVAAAGQPPAQASTRFERALTGGGGTDASVGRTPQTAEPTQPVADADPPAAHAPPQPGSSSPAAGAHAQASKEQPSPSDDTSDTAGQERPARSIGTSAAAAAALAAATARHQAAQAAARARAETHRDSGGHPLPAAASTAGLTSTSPPAVHGPHVHRLAAGTAPTTAKPDGSDDLLHIRGIDPDLQKQLDALGVRRFADIAGWKKDDVRRVSQALGFRGRIEQENWIEQAQMLMNGVETAFSRSRAGMRPLAKPSPDEGECRPIPAAPPTTARGLPAAVAGPAPATAAQPRRPVAGLGRENLQRIGRITPDIERLLNVQGVSRYEQIAHWSTSDVSRFEQLLGGDGRISRENWIEQAHILARSGETAFSREFDRQAAVPSRPRPTQLAEAIRAAQAEEAATHGAHADEPERAPSQSIDLNTLRSVRVEAQPGDMPEDASTIGSGPQPVARPDDLKRIRGIGSLLEKRLNSMGYRTYEQVASWTAAEVERVSRALDIRGRIERENWVEQARILASGQQTEFARRLDKGEMPMSRAVD